MLPTIKPACHTRAYHSMLTAAGCKGAGKCHCRATVYVCTYVIVNVNNLYAYTHNIYIYIYIYMPHGAMYQACEISTKVTKEKGKPQCGKTAWCTDFFRAF